jgi:phage gpG-like protein
MDGRVKKATEDVSLALNGISSSEEVSRFWKGITSLFNSRLRYLEEQTSIQFEIGDEVEWDGKRGYRSGKITKKSGKTATVKATEDGVQWRVAWSFLRKVSKKGGSK